MPRYTMVRNLNPEDLLNRVNILTARPRTDEGWLTGKNPKYNLVSMFECDGEFYAIIEEVI